MAENDQAQDKQNGTQASDASANAESPKTDQKQAPEGSKPAELDDKTAETGRIRQGGGDSKSTQKTESFNRSHDQVDVEELHRLERQKLKTSKAAADKLSSSDFTVGGEHQGFGYAGQPVRVRDIENS